jgi:CIC family chloride channel protein
MDFMTLPPTMPKRNIFDPERTTATLKPTDTLETALRVFDSSGHTRLPVVADERNGAVSSAGPSRSRRSATSTAA